MPVTSVSYFTAAGQPAFTDVATVGPIVWVKAFEDIADRVLFRQAYQTATTAYSPVTLNTTYPAGTVGGVTYLLVQESDFQEIDGGQMRWNRYYACTPPTRVEFTSSGQVFPGLLSSALTRQPLAFSSQTKITRDYYLVSTTGVGIPALNQEDRVTIAGSLVAPLLSEQTLDSTTNPTAATYIGYFAIDDVNPATFSVRSQADFLERWIGNFYARVQTQVKAK